MSFLATLMLANHATSQINNIFINGEVDSDRVLIHFQNGSDEDVTVDYVIVLQDEVFPLAQGESMIPSYEVDTIEIVLDSAEYHSYVCQISSGANLRVAGESFKKFVLFATKGKVTFHSSDIPNRLDFYATEYYSGGQISVYDLSGRQHMNRIVHVGSNSIKTSLPTGIYLAVIQKGSLFQTTKVFIR